jgi:predicted transcriptional regulator
MAVLTIEVSPELDRQLREEAEQRGQEVADYARALLEERLTRSLASLPAAAAAPVWERIVAAGQAIPEEERKNLPSDASANLDHYLYGARRQS